MYWVKDSTRWRWGGESSGVSNQLISKENEVHGDKKMVHEQGDISCNK